MPSQGYLLVFANACRVQFTLSRLSEKALWFGPSSNPKLKPAVGPKSLLSLASFPKTMARLKNGCGEWFATRLQSSFWEWFGPSNHRKVTSRETQQINTRHTYHRYLHPYAITCFPTKRHLCLLQPRELSAMLQAQGTGGATRNRRKRGRQVP